MDVILLQRIAKLGQMGDTVRVKNGYARNFLLPTGKALRATEANKKRFEEQKVELEARNLERKSEALAVAEKLGGQQLYDHPPGRRGRASLWFGVGARHRRGHHRRWLQYQP